MFETFTGLDVLLILVVIALAWLVRYAFRMVREQREREHDRGPEEEGRLEAPSMSMLLDATFRESVPRREP